MVGRSSQGMYPVSENGGAMTPDLALAAIYSQVISDVEFIMWHYKLGHPSFNVLKQILNQCNLYYETSDQLVCEACQK